MNDLVGTRNCKAWLSGERIVSSCRLRFGGAVKPYGLQNRELMQSEQLIPVAQSPQIEVTEKPDGELWTVFW